MSDHSKVFNYEIEGLSYTVTVYEEAGAFYADIQMTEGSMDVNAIYFGDDDSSGPSASLDGPLNMNGAKLDGENVQWDEAVALSDPGLGTEGSDKETYLTDGDTLTVSLDIDSLDEIDIFGIRATSATNDAGSIKGVSDDPEDPEDPEEASYEKVFFGEVFSDEGDPLGGTFILDEEPDPNPYSIPSLPEGTEPTFENYVNYFVSDEIGGEVSSLTSVVFYETDDDGDLSEVFRLDAPDGGFQDVDELLTAYDEATDGSSLTDESSESSDGQDLLAALTVDGSADTEVDAGEDFEEDDLEIV
ncbi:hypothetical protein [Parasedimentitalea huanghaiensis]|uniref:Uncharacterized protein n=1 Tax=Parasedimentitalea huanghaiensis TaxID=2682100 RepID=A0A6L6WED9_9RHOB|nr:hypothetical protein [Zongyanglinia huanghaiensis]MVO16253.1 hypothetical protein [Zongyanglinia huanghaiensis]